MFSNHSRAHFQLCNFFTLYTKKAVSYFKQTIDEKIFLFWSTVRCGSALVFSESESQTYQSKAIMFQVHVVGSSASLQHAPISTPALFAQLVYRTSRLGGSNGAVQVSASTTASGSDQSSKVGVVGSALDPALAALAAYVSGNEAAAEAETRSSSSPLDIAQFAGTVEPYPFFTASFIEVEQRFHNHNVASSNPYDLIVCADAQAFDSVCGWYAKSIVGAAGSSSPHGIDDDESRVDNEECVSSSNSSSTSAGSSRARRRHTVIAHVTSHSAEQQSRLPMLYSTLVSSLVATALQHGDRAWVHTVDTILQKLQSVRNCEVLYAIVG